MAEVRMSGGEALLHIGANGSEVTCNGASDDVRVVRIALGYAGVPATLFRGDIPTALELENAIAVVEDEVMPAARQLAGVTALVTAGAELRAFATAPPGDDDGIVALEHVEQLFDELSRVALGGPVSHLPFALTKKSAATLVILRELMHHAGVRTLRCVDR